ncbi:DHA2 family efflux MFS transporter permease subunit [Phosphitispora sp. TUW77]|uniref:DHA2 family efflux MFS transporter permease subunit n=1 Tax=Phosphitispora sp. TUW77 TaxID=3152361 RepID=UPI003AB78BFF
MVSFKEELKKRPYYKWLVFGNVAVGTFMATLDGSIVNVALPTISVNFGVGKETLQWAVTAYLLTISSLLLAFGRLADIIGKNRVYAAGFLGFVLGSALCGSAVTVHQLIILRIVQAIGAAMMMANAMGLITSCFPPRERGRALGSMGTVVALGSLTGPALGGFLVSSMGWRAIFYINIPIGILGFIAALFILPRDKDILQKQKFDYFGALLFGGGITSFLLALSEGQEYGWLSHKVLFLFAISVILLGLFFIAELKIRQPMIDLSLFRNRMFLAGNLAGLLSFVAMFFANYLLPFYMAEILGLKPYQMGLVMTAFPVVMALTAPLSGWLSDKIGPLLLTTGGLTINAIGLFLLADISIDMSPLSVAWKMALMGLGAGMFQSPNNSSVMGTVPPPKLGIAGGVVATVRNVGMVIGVALSVAIFNARFTALKSVITYKAAYVEALSLVFTIAAIIALFGAAISFVKGGVISESSGEPETIRVAAKTKN